MQGVQHEADTLPKRDKADHDRHDRGQKTDDLIEDAAQHIRRNNRAQRGSSCFLNAFLLSSRIMGAGRRFELRTPGSEPGIMPFDYPAICLLKEHAKELISEVQHDHNDDKQQIRLNGSQGG